MIYGQTFWEAVKRWWSKRPRRTMIWCKECGCIVHRWYVSWVVPTYCSSECWNAKVKREDLTWLGRWGRGETPPMGKGDSK